MKTTPSKSNDVRAGVGVILYLNGQVLVGLRKGSHGAGCWAFPGGHIEYTDRSLKECGEREILEETGIICNVISPDGFRQELFTTFEALGENYTKHYVTTYLLAEFVSGGHCYQKGDEVRVKPREPDKCEYWVWLSIERLIAFIQDQPLSKIWIPVTPVVHYITQHKLAKDGGTITPKL